MHPILTILHSFTTPTVSSTEIKQKNENLVIQVGNIELNSEYWYSVKAATIRKLIKYAKPAEFGWKDQTLLDKSVRDTWKISANLVKIDEGSWNKTLQPVIETIRLRMGIATGIKAQLQDLLIYEPGQFFSRHRDSEKCDGMVATLIVVLPIQHEGGNLVVEHQDEITIYYSDTKGQNISFFAFYADCLHEVTTVNKGYRVALTYNLVLQPSNDGVTPKFDTKQELSRNHSAPR
ncbi:hypothetical protein CCP4SC76_3020006 [Gammaproteobacteria bacterium]